MKHPVRIFLHVLQTLFLVLGAILILKMVIEAFDDGSSYRWGNEEEMTSLTALGSILLGIGFSPTMWGAYRPTAPGPAPQFAPQPPAQHSPPPAPQGPQGQHGQLGPQNDRQSPPQGQPGPMGIPQQHQPGNVYGQPQSERHPTDFDHRR